MTKTNNVLVSVRYQLVFLIVLFFTVQDICHAESRLVHSIDFTNQPEGDAHPWFEKKGYILKLDAHEIDLTFHNNQLNLETRDQKAGIIGLLLAPENYINNITSINIEWGVTRQPKGADWEKGNNRVPIAIMFFFGDEKISSGLPFGINSAPYFLSPFIGLKETPGKAYTGQLYKEGGRYICMAVSKGSNKVITSNINIDPRYLNLFNKEDIPPITGIAFQMNTEDTHGGASAFIRKLEFYTD